MFEAGYDWSAFALGFGAALLLALVIRWRAANRRRQDMTAPPKFAQTQPVLSEELKRKVRLLRAQGRLIEAIKLVREATGLGLKEAKDAVEALT